MARSSSPEGLQRPVESSSNLPWHHSLRVGRMRTCAEEHPPTARVHPHAALGYHLSGEATYWCGASYRLGPGDLMIIPEGAPHYKEAGSEGEVVGLALCLGCQRSEAGRALAEIFFEVAEGAPAARTVPEACRPALEGALLGLEQELSGDGEVEARRFAVQGYLSLVVSVLLRSAPAIVDPGGGPKLSARALGFISRHAARGISLVDVARHLSRSPAHVAAVVKADTGRTVVEWITESRLASARQLLLHTDETIEAIGTRVGFASASHFHRVFRKSHGVTPTAWRESHLRVPQRSSA